MLQTGHKQLGLQRTAHCPVLTRPALVNYVGGCQGTVSHTVLWSGPPGTGVRRFAIRYVFISKHNNTLLGSSPEVAVIYLYRGTSCIFRWLNFDSNKYTENWPPTYAECLPSVHVTRTLACMLRHGSMRLTISTTCTRHSHTIYEPVKVVFL